MLPEWIEHSTSPLPRGCSTTELRQHNAGRQQAPRERVGNCHKPNAGRKAKPLAGSVHRRIIVVMAKGGRSGAKVGDSGKRSGRLAAALRENLRRRKAQARGRVAAASQEPKDKACDDDRG